MASTQNGGILQTDICPLPRVCILQHASSEQGCIETYAPHGTVCDDGNPDTVGDACNGQGLCLGSAPMCPVPSKCISTYQSEGSQCVPIYAGSEAVCDDGNPNTMNDRCDGYGGCNGDPIHCPETTSCTLSYTLMGGMCVPQHQPPGTPCDDGFDHTTADICNGAGACLGQPSSVPSLRLCPRLRHRCGSMRSSLQTQRGHMQRWRSSHHGRCL